MSSSDYVVVVYVFFFFKQKTAYEMRISDWSSDVCSSDLVGIVLDALYGRFHVPFAPLEIDEAVTLLVATRYTARCHMAFVITATGLVLTLGQRLDGLTLPEAGLVDQDQAAPGRARRIIRSEENTSELQSPRRT